jgi:hypothetical protein
MNSTLTIEEQERIAYIKGDPNAALLGAILAAQEERDAMEEKLDAMDRELEIAEVDLADALDRLGAQ